MPEYFKKEMKGAADLRVRPSDATQNAAQSSRLVIRDKRHPKEPDLCHFANVEQFGGSISSPQMASEYADLLKPKARPSRKNCTTS